MGDFPLAMCTRTLILLSAVFYFSERRAGAATLLNWIEPSRTWRSLSHRETMSLYKSPTMLLLCPLFSSRRYSCFRSHPFVISLSLCLLPIFLSLSLYPFRQNTRCLFSTSSPRYRSATNGNFVVIIRTARGRAGVAEKRYRVFTLSRSHSSSREARAIRARSL